jgi:2-polyprenyl-6-methoxyphenol hydroxylase-like FAD-dependent oxidoreductase
MDVVIRGDGVAAYCCAYLLHKAGLRVALERVDRPRLPVVMLGEQAIALLRDVFEQPGLAHALPRIGKRVVAWGSKAKPVAVEHSAVVVSEEVLLERIRPSLISAVRPSQKARWTIFAARPLPAPAVEHCFGSRMASAVPVTLKDTSDPGACWIESLADGWLFLVPNAPTSGWLLAVGATAEALLGRSQLIAAEIAGLGSPSGAFPAYVRIASPLCAPDWLSCGTGAIAFDPICGDGTAHAVREAILASAVIRALANGGSAADLLSHYEARLTAGFRRHLVLCRGFYQSGGVTPLWRTELESIDRGIQWCDAKLGANVSFRYQLRGFELEPAS